MTGQLEPDRSHDQQSDQPGDQPPDLRLLAPALAAWAAAAVTLSWPVAGRLAAGGTLLTLLPAGAWARRRLRRAAGVAAGRAQHPAWTAVAMVLAASALCLGASGLQGWWRQAGTLVPLAERGATARLDGTLASDPRVVGSGFGGRDLVLVRLAVSRVEGRGQRSVVRSRVLVFADERWSQLRWGDPVQVTGRLGPARPGDDVVATLAARGPPSRTGHAPMVARSTERLRAGLRRACAGLPPDARGLLPGLVVGDTSLQSDDLGEAMRATGLTHLAAVSGTNITIVCVAALGLARAGGLGRRSRLVAAGLVLIGFVLLARPEPSVLRAAVMGGLGLLAVGAGRRRVATPALAFAVVGLLVVDPWLARSYGFALSVLATLGLLLLARHWAAVLARRLPRPLAVALAVPLAAQAACGPVVVLLSAQVSLVSLPANVVVAPLVAPATVLGLGAAVVSPAWPGAAALLAQVAGWACTGIATTARTLAEVPGGQVPWPSGAGGAVTMALATAAALLAGPRLLATLRARRGVRMTVGAGVLATVVALRLPVPGQPSWPPPGWEVVACDVGQGDALVLRSGPGRAVLVDAGPDPDAVDACLDRLDVQALDAVVLTHFHADHVDGLPGALRGRRTAEIQVTIVDDPPAQAQQVRRTAARAGVPVRVVSAGERATAGRLSWRVLWPERVLHDGSVANNASLVLRAEVAGLRVLLLGDVEPAAARMVARRNAEQPEGPVVDVVKVAHHGSAKQDNRLMAEAAPRLALVSVGAGNDYGHPSPAALRLAAAAGASIGRTDQYGDLAVVAAPGGPRLVTSGPRPHPPPRPGGHGSEHVGE